MGYIRHDAIVVTNWNKEHLREAFDFAVGLGMAVSEIVESPVNGYCSFLVAPDGSKEGWAESTGGDGQREQFIQWMRDNNHRLWLDWVAVNYGGDDSHECRITDFSGREEAD